MNGYSLVLVPMSWAFGRKDVRNKTLWAFGPLRLAVHRNLKPWRGV